MILIKRGQCELVFFVCYKRNIVGTHVDILSCFLHIFSKCSHKYTFKTTTRHFIFNFICPRVHVNSSFCRLALGFGNCTSGCHRCSSSLLNCQTRRSNLGLKTLSRDVGLRKIRSHPQRLNELCRLSQYRSFLQICAQFLLRK